MRRLIVALLVLLVVALAGAAGVGVYGWRRALPPREGSFAAPGLGAPTEIVRDRWGVPHIFAASDEDAYYALGYAMAQDRLFQLDLLRHVSQGRLAELFGEAALEVDVLFRTVNVPGVARRMFAAARPEVQAALHRFADGANAWLAALGGSVPPEYLFLRTRPAPFRADDFVGVVGTMTWGLNPGWRMDVLYERIVAQVGPRRAAELFPRAARGPLAVATVRPRGPLPEPTRLRLTAAQEALLERLPGLRGSNSWALGAARSATGGALLASDPHLGLGQPATWYLAHLRTPEHEVIGAFLPGLPFAIIGHNRDVAWGLVNGSLDAGDFFVERLDPQRPGRVLHRGRWVPLEERRETIHVKGGAARQLTVLSTPHGPLVHELLAAKEAEGARTQEREEAAPPPQALSYRWVYAVAEDANEIDGFYDLNRARDWASFRAALSRFGAVAQQATYADRRGHVGVQATGRVPRRAGRADGVRYRNGWAGTEEWDGLLPFADNPSTFDPPDGVVAVANEAPARVPEIYHSAFYEPEDRILRLRELLARKGRFSLDDLERIQTDTLFVTGRALAPRVVAAFAAEPRGEQPPEQPPEPPLRAALSLLERWDGQMAMHSAAATVFALFYKHLFHELFDDELGPALTAALRRAGNPSATMVHAVLHGGDSRGTLEHWFDRTDTPEHEGRAEVYRAALRKAVAELVQRLGDDPADWQWGRLHQVEFAHPLGRVRWLAPLFNEGPVSVAGHAQTVAKAQFHDEDFAVYHGASLRTLTNLDDPAHARAVLPTGQSGLPASPHYADQIPLWREGRYLPLLMEREDIERFSEGRLLLRPPEPAR